MTCKQKEVCAYEFIFGLACGLHLLTRLFVFYKCYKCCARFVDKIVYMNMPTFFVSFVVDKHEIFIDQFDQFRYAVNGRTVGLSVELRAIENSRVQQQNVHFKTTMTIVQIMCVCVLLFVYKWAIVVDSIDSIHTDKVGS